jgi:hypothetical protein
LLNDFLGRSAYWLVIIRQFAMYDRVQQQG